MTLSTLFETIKTVYEGVEGVMSVYDDDAALSWNTQEVKYLSVAFSLQSSREMDGNVHHTFQIYAGDRLTDSQANRNELYNKLYNVLKTGINELTYTEGIVEVEDNRVYTYLPLKMFDVLAVCSLTVTIVVTDEENC